MADYSINAITRKVSYSGSAGVGPYAFTFEILDQNDVAVYKNTTLLALTTDYTVTINANGTGSVTLVVAATGSDTIVILGARDIERTTDFVTAGDLRAESLNEQLDSLVIFDQQIDERVDRAVRAPAYDPTGINMTLPAVADRGNKFLGFTAGGNSTVSTKTITEIESAVETIETLASASAGSSAAVSHIASGIGATSTTVQAKLRELISVKDFGATGDGTTDDSAAIQAAITAAPSNGVIVVPPGSYACDTMITTGSKTLFLYSGATVFRPSSAVSTDPVIWINNAFGGVIGQGRGCRVSSQVRAPYGVIRIGHEDMTTSNGNISYCFVKNIYVSGSTIYGQTTGDPDQCIAVYNPQFSGLASYFHTIQSCVVVNSNTGIGLHGWANANIINDIQLYRVGNDTALQYRKAIHIDGAQENMISDVFHHSSPNAYTIYMEVNDNTGNSGTTHNPIFNTIRSITSEQGGASARGVVVASSGGDNHIHNIRNTATGNSYYAGFTANNSIASNTAVTYPTLNASDINAATMTASPDGTNAAFAVDTNGVLTGYLADRREGLGQATTIEASALKYSLTADGASVAFTLSCNAQASVYRHGYVYLICSSEDSGTLTADTAWFLLRASSSLADAYPGVNVTPIDSGGDTGSYTITYSAGVLTVTSAATHDNLIVDIKFALAAINNVNIT